MAIAGQTPATSRVNNIRVTSSSQGKPVPAAMGQGRLHQSLLWLDGLVSWKSDMGGKGGGKSTAGYIYASNVIAALCNGPVAAIGSVWDGQTQLSTTSKNDSVTIAAVYAPSYPVQLLADNGVSLATTYSATYNDFGAPAATVLSGTDAAPMKLVPYGTALTTGEYSINPASIGTFTLTAVANASGGNTVYTGTFTGGASPYSSGASNAYIGFAFVIAGFSNPLNNGTFVCVASSASSVTLANANGVAQTHAATAAETGNTYHFSSADVGKSAVINYQLSTQELMNQETDVIPSGLGITVGGTYNPTVDMGVIWYSTSGTPGPNDMQPLTKITSGTPSTGQYKYATPGSGSSGGAQYTFATADIGKEVLISYKYENLSAATNNTPNLLKFELFGGGISQAIWPFILSGGTSAIGTQDGGQSPRESAFPGAALGYSNTAYLAYGPMSLGSAGEIPDITVEVITPDAVGGGIVDCNPIRCITQVLTNTVWGLGAGAVPFPVSALDNGSTGTWGSAAGTPGTRTTNSTAYNWFAANSFFISPVLDAQDSAASHISKWLEAGMCAAFVSEGLLKLVPYGTQSAAGNGCTWVAPSSAVVALDDSCFVHAEGVDPVKISREAWQDGWNEVQVTWNNRAYQYSDELTQEFDQACINRWGLRLEDPQSWNFITTLPAAVFAANMRVKRSVNIRNQYVFSLPFCYSYLEPMDIIEISTTSAWAAGLNNVNLGITNLPVRIKTIVDDPIAGLEITCEDSLFSVGLPVIYNKSISAGDTIVNAYANPGSSEVVMFEATNRLTGYAGNQIWMGACGTSDNYGSTNVWVSRDGSAYLQVGSIDQQARMGVLASTFASGSDPDTTNSLVVNMVENSGQMEAGSTSDADNGTTLCFVDGEIVAYSACAISGQNQYTMNGYIRRGQMGSTVASHAANSLFMRLDSSVFKYTYDPTWAGQTLYFKFQAVNTFGNMAQDISTLPAVTFVVPGLNPGTIDASSGLLVGASAGQGGCPVSAATTVSSSLTFPTTIGAWTTGLTVALPGTIEFDVFSTGGIVDLMLYASAGGSGPTAYVVRFDGRSGNNSGQIFKIVNGASTGFIGSAVGAVNGTALSGWHHVKVQVSGGQLSVFVDGAWQWKAVDSSLSPTGATYFGYEVASGMQIAPTGFVAKTVDQLPDGATYNRTTVNQVTGAGRAYNALDANNQVASQLNAKPLYAIQTFSSGNPLSQSGSTKTILIAASTINWGSNAVNYSSCSVTPAVYGLRYIYADDPTFAGGAVTYLATTNQLVLFQSDGRVSFGSITTASGGGGVGGGGSCFSPNTKIKTQRGDVSFWDIREGDLALTARGTWRSIVLVRCSQQTDRPMLDMGNSELVTLGHLFKSERWTPASELGIFAASADYTGFIANLCIDAEADDDGSALDTEHSYTLANGHIVHNMPQGTS